MLGDMVWRLSNRAWEILGGKNSSVFLQRTFELMHVLSGCFDFMLTTADLSEFRFQTNSSFPSLRLS